MSRAPQWVRASFVELSVRYRSLSVQARSALWDLLAEQQANGFVAEAMAQVPSRVRSELEPLFPVVAPGRRAAEWLDIELQDAGARAERGAVLAARRWRPGEPLPVLGAPAQVPGPGEGPGLPPPQQGAPAAGQRRPSTRRIPL